MWNWFRYVCCVTLVIGCGAPAFGAGDAALFVAGVQGSDARAASWVEGVWFGDLGSQARSTETSLGGVPSAKLVSLEKAKKSFQAGKKAFDDLSPDSAFRSFRKAVRQFEEALPHIRDMELLAKSWAYIGVSYLLNGKNDEGQAAFRRALLLQPKFDIKIVTKDQAKISLFSQVRQSLTSEGKTRLKVSSQPAGAVYVNGRFVGISPVQLQIPKGTHVVVVRRPGWRWWGKQVAVSGAGFSASAKLTRRSAIGAWKKAGVAAVVHTLKRPDVPTEVAAFGTLTKGKQVVLARVKVRNGGKQLVIQAAVYDIASQKQLAAGGALVPWGPSAVGRAAVIQLLRELRRGSAAAIGGWTPSALGVSAPKGGGGGSGLAIGLGVGIGVAVAAGATILILALTKPELFGGTPSCNTNGACVTLVVK